MERRPIHFSTFIRFFTRYLLVVREVVVGLLVFIVVGGLAFSFVEGHPVSESLYFAFITAVPIGFGDIVPATSLGRVLSVGIGLVGMLFVGLIIAIAVRALTDTIKGLDLEKR